MRLYSNTDAMPTGRSTAPANHVVRRSPSVASQAAIRSAKFGSGATPATHCARSSARAAASSSRAIRISRSSESEAMTSILPAPPPKSCTNSSHRYAAPRRGLRVGAVRRRLAQHGVQRLFAQRGHRVDQRRDEGVDLLILLAHPAALLGGVDPLDERVVQRDEARERQDDG